MDWVDGWDRISLPLDQHGIVELTLLQLLNFHFMPRVGIQQVSLKACRRWVSTCDRMMVVARIDEPSDPLDSKHRDSARVGWPSNLVPWIRDHFFGQFWKLGFCSVSDCEIFAHWGQIFILLDHEGVDSIPT